MNYDDQDDQDPLFPYQQTGARWLSSRTTALLADEMGLGKSAQAITAINILKAKRVLVLCPAVARVNWKREFEKFSSTPFTFDIVTGTNPKISSPNSIICSYDLAHTLLTLSNLGVFDVLILDEAHFLKNPTAKRTKTVFGKAGLCRLAAKTWALSGTPAPNHAGELWPMLFTFGVTTLTFELFVRTYCDYYFGPHKDLRITGSNSQTIPELKRLLSTIMLRRRKEEVMKELPSITFSDLTVEATPVDLEVASSFVQYIFPADRTKELKEKLTREKALIKEFMAMVWEKDPNHPRINASWRGMQALATSVATIRRWDGISKVKAIAELLAFELENNAYDKIVIFAVHQDVIEGFRRALYDFGAVTLYGGTPPEKRQRNIDRFQNSPHTRVFIGNIQASGTAITLTAAHHILFAEMDWTPANNAQAAMRCHRIGQTRPVSVRIATLNDSIDQKVNAVLKRKTRELTKIFDK